MTYDPNSSGALSYLEAANEMAERNTTPDASGIPTPRAVRFSDSGGLPGTRPPPVLPHR
jgi:hypothetical protein